MKRKLLLIGWIMSLLQAFPVLSFDEQQLRFSQITLKDGLSQSFISCIHQDQLGFMWFGTQDGLNRYDGYQFTIYQHDPADSNSISSNFIYDISEDSQGKLWIATSNGLNIYDPEMDRFETVRHNASQLEAGPIDNFVVAIEHDKNGDVWVGTGERGISVFNASKGIWEHHQYKLASEATIGSNRIGDILLDESGQIWVATLGGGISKFDRKGKRFKTYQSAEKGEDGGPITEFIWRLAEDHLGRIWMGANKGVSCAIQEKDGLKFFHHLLLDNDSIPLDHSGIYDVCVDKKNNLWVATFGGGLNKLVLQGTDLNNIQTFNFTSELYNPNALSDNAVTSLFEDRAGILWIGTQHGLNKFDPNKQSFVHFRKQANSGRSITSNIVWSILPEDESNYWIGTRLGLNKVNASTGEVIVHEGLVSTFKGHTVSDQSIYKVFAVGRDTLLIGTNIGLMEIVLSRDHRQVLSAENLNFSNAREASTSQRVYDIYRDKRGVYWIGSISGVARYDRRNKRFLFETLDRHARATPVVRCLYQDTTNVLWAGTQRGLVKLWNLYGDSLDYQTVQVKDTLGKERVFSISSIHPGDARSFWMGTFSNGLLEFDIETETIRQFTKKNGLSNNVVYGVLKDNSGKLWMSTNYGVSTFNPDIHEFVNYHENDGLQSEEFNMGAFAKTRDGKLAFGGINGFNLIFPERLRVNRLAPEVVITELKVFNQPISPGTGIIDRHISYADQVQLDYDENNLTFELSALHYSFPERNLYQYKLSGIDERWNDLANERIIHYANLDPGEYTLLVRAANSDGVWNDRFRSLKVIVTPPFWSTWWFRGTLLFCVIALIVTWNRYRIRRIKSQNEFLEEVIKDRTEKVIEQKNKIETQKEALEKEKEKVENLLLNILPYETAEELKTRGKASARNYRLATVLFTDVKGFTKISETLRPQQIITELDSHFVKYDEIIERHQMEKIKTIGDSYMCAGGVPIRNKSNPFDVVLAGLEVQRHMRNLAEIKRANGEEPWQVRLGIHSGELIAGVIGIKRFAYDIWGDTVNVANAMQECGEVGKVNISGKTYEHVKEFFQCIYRGKVGTKGIGEIDMYFVERLKPEFSKDAEGVEPNDMFWEYVNLELYSSINYRKAEKHIVKTLEAELSEDLHYHDIDHMKDVCRAIEYIAKAEGVKGEDLFLLKTAALYHDAGFIEEYFSNESIGVDMAKRTLPKFGYADEQIELVGQLIMATKIPHHPNNKLEEIICDADLDYLGRNDFYEISNDLMRELMSKGVVKTEKEWDEIQIKFLSEHRYFTNFSKANRKPQKEKRLEEIKQKYLANDYA